MTQCVMQAFEARRGRRRRATTFLAIALCVGIGALLAPARVVRGNGGADEWHQHAHDAQRTSYAPYLPPTPWRWKWSFQGPTSTGGVSRGKRVVPRNTQPITGGGKVFIALGRRGVWALDEATGRRIWRRRPPGGVHSTPAFDAATNSLYVLSGSGRFYRLDASTGRPSAVLRLGFARSTLPLPPALLADRVIAVWESTVWALDKTSLATLWSYDAGSPLDTPPAYSPSRNTVVVVSSDLYVHAIDNANGSLRWRSKPTPRTGGDPGGNDSSRAEAKFGWPVISEVHGLVLVKYRLDWQAMWVWSPWPSDNAAMRNNLSARPEYQALFVVDLDDGSVPFIANVGHGGFGDGDYMPMGPQPVIRALPGGQAVAYVVMRGSPCSAGVYCDGRGDSHLGELVLDDTTVPGYQAGDVRFIRSTFLPTDEQPNLSAAGDAIFGAHWAVGIAHQITDRSPSKGTGTDPIATVDLPHVAVADNHGPFDASHEFTDYLCAEGCARQFPPGFYIYYAAAPVWDRYWSEWATWVVSGQSIYFLSTDGALVALEPASMPSPLRWDGNAPLAVNDLPPEDMAPTGVERAPCPPTGELIDPARAKVFAGCTVTVAGTVETLVNNRKAVHFSFASPHRGNFQVIVRAPHWKNFPANPDVLFPRGTRIRVRGEVGWYQGDPVIFVSSAEQITMEAQESQSHLGLAPEARRENGLPLRRHRRFTVS